MRKRPCGTVTPLDFIYLLLRRLFFPEKTVNIANAIPMIRELGGKEVVEMLKDPEINFDYSFRFIVDIIAARNNKVNELSDINLPVLLLHGRKDRHVYSIVSEEFCKLIKSKDKKVELFDSDHWFFHSIFYKQDDSRYSENDRSVVIDAIKAWLTRSSTKDN
jgi:alpha-beta hydrolase superfamily lysophospholipase